MAVDATILGMGTIHIWEEQYAVNECPPALVFHWFVVNPKYIKPTPSPNIDQLIITFFLGPIG